MNTLFIQYAAEGWVNIANIARVYRDSGDLKFDTINDLAPATGETVEPDYETPFLAAVRGATKS